MSCGSITSYALVGRCLSLRVDASRANIARQQHLRLGLLNRASPKNLPFNRIRSQVTLSPSVVSTTEQVKPQLEIVLSFEELALPIQTTASGGNDKRSNQVTLPSTTLNSTPAKSPSANHGLLSLLLGLPQFQPRPHRLHPLRIRAPEHPAGLVNEEKSNATPRLPQPGIRAPLHRQRQTIRLAGSL